MPGFKEKGQIALEPYSENVPYTFEFTVCSAATANDGRLPFGDSLSVCAVTGYDINGNEAAGLVGPVNAPVANIVTVPLSYPTAGPGRYKLTFRYETSNGVKDELDFDRVVAADN
jgi:hypothetical protein